jgi:glycerol-3-phosphate dehydrogenase (NAD(P)+)
VEHDTGLFPLEIAACVLPGRDAAVLTGPNFAREIAAGLPAASVIAGGDAALRAMLLEQLAGPTFRLYGNDDAVGAQLGGAAKNVVAVAAGAVTGAGLGENARAALITRGLAEIARLAIALGGRADTVAGLSGLGDLVLTCTGPASRNFALGLGLGRGTSLSALLPADGPAVEAVGTAPAILTRASDADLPIIGAVADLLAGTLSLPDAIARLLSRPLKNE